MNYTSTGFSGQSNPQPRLKSCPFCGRNAVLYASRPSQWIIQCMNLRCGCHLVAHYEEEVIKMWNGRVDE